MSKLSKTLPAIKTESPWSQSPDHVLHYMGSDVEQGLTQREAKHRLHQFVRDLGTLIK